ncbi:hypothetical protein Aperf_G00000040456 [Anoplocephala perfoliata]
MDTSGSVEKLNELASEGVCDSQKNPLDQSQNVDANIPSLDEADSNQNVVIRTPGNDAVDVGVKDDLEQGVKNISSAVNSDATPAAPEQPVDGENEVDTPLVPSLEADPKISTTIKSETIQDLISEVPVATSEVVGDAFSPKSVEVESLDSCLAVENQAESIYGSHLEEEQGEMEQPHTKEEVKADDVEPFSSGLDLEDHDEPLTELQGTPPPTYQASLRNHSGERCGKIEAQSPELEQFPSNAENQHQESYGPLPSTSFDQSDVKPLTSGITDPSSTVCKDSSVHQIKWIHFNGAKVPVITQNENGPCPMIAITNVLLLRRKLTLPPDHEVVSSDLIIASLSDELLSYPATNLDEDLRLNYEVNLSSAFSIFPNLQTGLDINVRFTGVADFEYTTALTIFDLFRIPIFHGWVADPQDLNLVKVLRNQTYNQVVEMIIDYKSSEDPERIHEGLLAEEFLESAASQLTMCGLCELNERLQEGQLAIFFRNNHFNTIYKKNGQIYMLLTDVGFVNEPNFVWETLNNIDGDSQFVDGEFKVVTKPASPTVSPDSDNPSSLTPSAPVYPTQMDLHTRVFKSTRLSKAELSEALIPSAFSGNQIFTLRWLSSSGTFKSDLTARNPIDANPLTGEAPIMVNADLLKAFTIHGPTRFQPQRGGCWQRIALEQADLELAKQLQEEERAAFLKESSAKSPPPKAASIVSAPLPTAAVAPASQQQHPSSGQDASTSPTSSTSSPSSSYQEALDLELARRLQAEEDAAYYAQQQCQKLQQSQQQRSTPGSPQPQQQQRSRRSPPSGRSSPGNRCQRQQQHRDRHQRDPSPSWVSNFPLENT